jgi:hypothetical protein
VQQLLHLGLENMGFPAGLGRHNGFLIYRAGKRILNVWESSGLFMDSYLASRISSFRLATLRNGQLFRANCALHPKGITNLNILDHDLLRPE